jgi:DNA-binding transcriptional MerR regulator
MAQGARVQYACGLYRILRESMSTPLPPIPAKRYFTIGEVAELCGVKPHVLRYWEQEFTQLRPMKRRGNRRYYQHHEVLMIRRIRELLYDQGFTISGARNRLQELAHEHKEAARDSVPPELPQAAAAGALAGPLALSAAALRKELEEIRSLLFRA